MEFQFIYYHFFITIGVYDHILVACFLLKQEVSLCRLGLRPNCKTIPPTHKCYFCFLNCLWSSSLTQVVLMSKHLLTLKNKHFAIFERSHS